MGDREFMLQGRHGERFGLLAVNPGGSGPVCVLVAATRPGPCFELLLLRPHQQGILQPDLVATYHVPLTSLIWDLVPWVSEERQVQVQELVITSIRTEIIISRFIDQEKDKVLEPLCVVRCDVLVSACVLQTWVPRIIYTGGSGAGKIDITFHHEKLEVRNTLQFPPWLTEDNTPCFLSIGCVENKWEVFLGDASGRIYTYGTQHTTVDTTADKFTLKRDMTVPFPVHCLVCSPPSRGSSLLSILAIGGNECAAVLTLDPARSAPCTLCLLSQEKVCVATWCRAEDLSLITTMDSKRQMHHWRKDMSPESGGEWMPWAVRSLEEDGVGLAWSGIHFAWLAYTTPARVVLLDMSELIHH